MYRSLLISTLLPAGLCVLVAQAYQGMGPDLVATDVGEFGGDNFIYLGTADGIRAFSMAASVCNAGDVPADSIAGITARHPVIAQHLYRLGDGRFEQVGMSWIKHMFCGGVDITCGACQATGSCDSFGVGCSDTYTAGTNDGHFGGSRWQIDPQGLGLVDGHAATHIHPFDAPSGPIEIAGRLQISDDDILAGGLFFAEVQYLTHDEALARRHDNAAWRPVDVTLTSITGAGASHAGEPALLAWTLFDNAVDVVEVNVPGEGRFHLGSRVYDNGDATWDYEYALHNLNSDRAARSFAVQIGSDVAIIATGFHDIDYHSGDGMGGIDQDGTDWTATVGMTQVLWTTDSFETNENANALRWGTLYNFRLTADTPPRAGTIQVELFKPGTPASVSVVALVPRACVGDIDADGYIGIGDFLALLAAWGPMPGHPADLDGDGQVGISDFLTLLAHWGPCPNCGEPLAGSCFQPGGSTGCDNAECCLAVCEIEPTCCNVAWSGACVQIALVTCRSCGDPATGACDAANGTPYCDDQPCCEAVCAVDPACCASAWTQACVALEAGLCNGCGGAGTGSCCEANGTPFCGDGTCCDLVCDLAPFCCLSEWDTTCAAIACAAGGLCVP